VPGQCKFPRAERLTRKSEYAFVFEYGEKVVGRYFVCYMARREGMGCKLGLAVSRKVGKAVVRNRVKRHVREFYRTHFRGLPTDLQVVVVARPPSAALNCRECAESIGALLQRGGVLHG
jgi:ribonuclease P protein component